MVAHVSHLQAPFTPEQVDSINGFQDAGVMHPFTCPCDDHSYRGDHWDGSHVSLVATEDNMVCPDPACPYTQSWVHHYMADNSWTASLAFFDNLSRAGSMIRMT